MLQYAPFFSSLSSLLPYTHSPLSLSHTPHTHSTSAYNIIIVTKNFMISLLCNSFSPCDVCKSIVQHSSLRTTFLLFYFVLRVCVCVLSSRLRCLTSVIKVKMCALAQLGRTKALQRSCRAASALLTSQSHASKLLFRISTAKLSTLSNSQRYQTHTKSTRFTAFSPSLPPYCLRMINFTVVDLWCRFLETENRIFGIKFLSAKVIIICCIVQLTLALAQVCVYELCVFTVLLEKTM